jgi:hypothetical protein
MADPDKLEAARLRMLEAQKALEDYETLKVTPLSIEHTRLKLAFTKATANYLRLSQHKP